MVDWGAGGMVNCSFPLTKLDKKIFVFFHFQDPGVQTELMVLGHTELSPLFQWLLKELLRALRAASS